MKKSLLFLLLFATVSACNNATQTDAAETDTIEGRESEKLEWKTFESSEYHFAFKYPSHWQVLESKRGKFPVINVFPEGQEKVAKPPYQIHEESEISFISIFPKSYSSELPFGRSQSLAGNDRFAGRAFDADSSTALLLENNHVWGLHLPFKNKFKMDTKAYLFAQIAVSKLKTKCLSQSGSEIAVEDCAPKQGDTYQRYATINENHRQIVHKIIESFRSLDEEEATTPTAEIRVINPRPNQKVDSPLKINGKALGSWFHEGEIPVLMEDRAGNVLGESFAIAQGEVRTDRMITFGGTISFEIPADNRGVLVVEKHHALNPEDTLSFRVPVTFTPTEK